MAPTRLEMLSDELHQAGVERTAAADGLAVAHRNPGVMDEDVISMLWDDLESSSVRQARLDRVITAIEEMEFPALLVLFMRPTCSKQPIRSMGI